MNDHWFIWISLVLSHLLDEYGKWWGSDSQDAFVQEKALLSIDDDLKVAADLVIEDTDKGRP